MRTCGRGRGSGLERVGRVWACGSNFIYLVLVFGFLVFSF